MGGSERPMARIVVESGRVVLEVGARRTAITASQVFRVAIRGVEDLDGLPVSPRVDLSAPGIVFRQDPEEVVLLIRSEDGGARATAAIRHKGGWHPVQLAEDHVLIDREWHPIEGESLSVVGRWLEDHDQDPGLSAEDYLELYRGLGMPIRIVDELSDNEVAKLAGGSESVSGLKARLYPYQAEGLRWLSARANAGLGGILADEMGLGKTIQVIALIVQRRASNSRVGPAIVIVPATLLENWGRELARFAPSLRVYRHSGGSRTRRPTELTKPDVVLVTYETAVIDQAVLDQVAWDLVVLDEAQGIKNPDTQRSLATRAIPRHAAFAVTGTPLENRTLDTWSLADFAVPGYLGTRSSFQATIESEPELLGRALRPLILRREVEGVAADLPEKIEADVALEMFAPEAQLYEEVREAVRGDRTHVPILALLTKLRMFTAHPDCVYGRAPHPLARSAKLTRLLEILEELQPRGVKSLVFVAFNEAADIIVSAVQGRFGCPVWAVDGRTAVGERQRIIDQFSAIRGPAVLVLNPAAAGVGLNIQAASHVVHYTLEWNPAREAQATARAWRTGQTVPVIVHRLFYAGTIDEMILDRLQVKRDLFDAVIQPSEPSDDAGLRSLMDRALDLGRPSRSAEDTQLEEPQG